MMYKGPIRSERPISARMADAIRWDSDRITLSKPVAVVRMTTTRPATPCFAEAAKAVCGKMQGLALAYYSRDLGEVSFVFKKKTQTAQPWHGYNIRKMAEHITSMITAEYAIAAIAMYTDTMLLSAEEYTRRLRKFNVKLDIFSISASEACNYLIWRQREVMDATHDATQHGVVLVKSPPDNDGRRVWVAETAPVFAENRTFVDHRVSNIGGIT